MSSYIVSLLVAERDRLDAAIQALQGGPASAPVKRPGRPPATKAADFDYDAPNVPDWVKPKAPVRKKGGMSAAGRKAISDATKARWARLRTEKAKAAAPGVSKKKSAILAAIAPPEDAEFKKKMSIAMKAAWAKRKKTAAGTKKKAS
jgi:hypothetical protein